MATLEKIRSKSVLLLIIIGVALLAFIIGDFFNSSRTLFGPDNSVANIDGEKIEASEYQNRSQSLETGNSDEERAYVQQMLLRSMMLEKLQNEEYENLGITVTDDELNDMINGSGKMFADRMAADYAASKLKLQVQSAAELQDVTNNPTKYGYPAESKQQLQQFWLDFENEMVKFLTNNKFISMLSGTMVANDLDIAQSFADDQTGYMISYVQKPYVVDPNIKVTDDEIQKAWEAEKKTYAVKEEQRLINFISVPIAPSVDDEDAARALMAEVIEGLNTTDGVEALRGRKGFDNQQTTMTNAFIADIVKQGGNADLKAFVDSAAEGQAKLIQDGPVDFQIAKLLKRGEAVDSVTISFVAFDSSVAGVADTLKAALAAGKKAADLQAIEGVAYVLDSVPASITNPMIANREVGQLISAEISGNKDAFISNELGKPFEGTVESGIGTLYTVTSRKAPQSNVELALISYRLDPSRATIDNLRSGLEKFIAANGDATKFVANAAAANYAGSFNLVSASSPYVVLGQNPQNGQPIFMPNSHQAARWALEAEKGSVSPIFGDQRTGAFLVATLVDVYPDYVTTTYPQVKTLLTDKVRKSKVGDTMVKQYTGKANDIAGYAAVMGTEPATDAVNFLRSGRIYGSELLGKIVTSATGKVSTPEKGENGVFVYQVTSVNKPTRKLDKAADAQTFNATRGVSSLNDEGFFQLLLGNRPFENRLLKVFKED